MICSRCQRPVEGTATYCPYCGAPMQEPASAFAAAVPYQTPVQTVQPEHPVVGPIKRLASSTLFLVAAIAVTLATVLGIVSTLSGESGALTARLEELMAEEETNPDDLGNLWQDEGDNQFYGEDFYYDEGNAFGNGEMVNPAEMQAASQVLSLVFSLPVNGLMIAALWMIYATGKRRDYPGMKTGGFTILQVMNVLTAVLMGLCTLLMLLLALVLPLFAQGESALVMGVVAVMMMFLVGVCALMTFYTIKVAILLSKTKRTVTSGVPTGKGGLFVAVMCFIIGVFNGFSALSVLLFGGVITALSTVASAVATFCFGVVCLRYRALLLQFSMLSVGAPQTPYGMPQSPMSYGMPQPAYRAPAVPYAPPPATPVSPVASTPSAPTAPFVPPAPPAPAVPAEEPVAVVPETEE